MLPLLFQFLRNSNSTFHYINKQIQLTELWKKIQDSIVTIRTRDRHKEERFSYIGFMSVVNLVIISALNYNVLDIKLDME
jgi:hypothetical protein